MKKLYTTIVIALLSINAFGQAPQWEWVKLFGDSHAQQARGIEVDKEGNSYVCGIFYGLITFDSITFDSRGANDIFIAKFDPCGNVIWAKQAGGIGYDGALGNCIDNNGNSYITGYVADSALFDTNQTLTTHKGNVFVAKYDNNGNNVWVRNSIGAESYGVYGNSVSVDNNGNVYFVGDFGIPTLSFDTITITNGLYESGIFIGKYDSNGNILWVKKTSAIGGGVNDIHNYSIAVDSTGNSFVTGEFEGTVHFDSLEFHATASIDGWNSSDIFIVKYDNSGNVIWAEQAGGNGADAGIGICIDSYGNSYITGFYSMTANFDTTSLTALNTTTTETYLAKYDYNGNNVWAKKSVSIGGGITIDRNEELYTPIAKYNTSGDSVWSKSTGDYLYNYETGVDDSLNVYVAGFLMNTPTITLDTFHLTQMGGGDMFIGKLIVNPHNNCGWNSPDSLTVSVHSQIKSQSEILEIFPNPFTSQTTIKFGETQKNTTIKITDLFGKVIRTLTFTGRQLIIDKAEMRAGIYFVQTTDEQKRTCNKKIIIQ